ncbi:hypothetical protein GIB67_033979 [Kingdonia uniflora]|uniref:Prolamin-like domain-containing protein n=1 Tax=Kingdonia uniflora TaxID=39325 RepID=A0A7J7M645_9MAGN|nr:hypothetical protein GIB67_033979 [Kingdonia uniflora]
MVKGIQLLLLACVTMLFSPALAHQLPNRDLPFVGILPGIDAEIKQVPSINGKFGVISHACCNAIVEVRDKSWPKMFPFNPLFPPLLKGFSANTGLGVPTATSTIKLASPVTVASRVPASKTVLAAFSADPGVQKCLSTLQRVERCVQDVITSFLSFHVRLIGPACCKAIVEVNDSCWHKIFPVNLSSDEELLYQSRKSYTGA